MKRFLIPLAVVALIGTAGCSGMNDTQQRTLSGGAAGAVGGAIGGAVTGCIWCGAVVGGALGAAGGYVFDLVNKDDQPSKSTN
ncbi:MAG TPA: hypothetical protein VL244_11970 [Alphaproteobacteria bacterium]|nr:hypothetical protein [Alphaproteobacteria bacterium]